MVWTRSAARIIAVASLAVAACSSEADTDSGSSHTVEVASEVAEASHGFGSTSALEEIVAATNFCRSIVSKDDERTSDEFKALLEENGYSANAQLADEVRGSRDAIVEYLEKDAFETEFAVIWVSEQRSCMALVRDFSGTPVFEDMRPALISDNWKKSAILGSPTQRSQLAVMSVDGLGNHVVATLSKDPEPGSNIAISVAVSYVEI